MKRSIIPITFLCFLLSSCSNDDIAISTQSNDPEPEIENFYALTVGNSWEYDRYDRDTETGEYVFRGNTETIEITGTTVINDNEFFVFESKRYNSEGELFIENTYYQRDSLGYLINSLGKIQFSNVSEEDIYLKVEFIDQDNEITLSIFGSYLSDTENIDLEAGQFDAVVNEYYALQGDQEDFEEGREYIYYSDGIGLIQHNLSTITSTSHYTESRLKSFTIN